MKKTLLALLLSLALSAPGFSAALRAQPDSLRYSDTYLDTVRIDRTFVLNDYPMIAFEYGGSLNRMNFSLAYKQQSFFVPEYFGVSFMRYGKMFGYMPYFGYKVGLYYGHEGYMFKEDKETHTVSTINGATKVVYDVVEMPFLTHMHYDFVHFKLMANVGLYGGYRLRIHRFGARVPEEIAESFLETDRRLDYGLQGGAGFALVFSPLEIHFNAALRYSWATIYDPDYYSPYYYRFAYPFDVMFSAGVCFQLGKRTGKTNKVLRKEAHDLVYPQSSHR